MNEEPESTAEARVHGTLAGLPVFWLVLLYVLAPILPEELRSQVGLDLTFCVGVTVPMLIVSGLMVERAAAARRGSDT